MDDNKELVYKTSEHSYYKSISDNSITFYEDDIIIPNQESGG